jgi:dihydropteroate synthase
MNYSWFDKLTMNVFLMQIGSKEFDFSKPVIMGILNVTPDSFSDGGSYFNHNSAVAHALQMVEEGADIIDIGGESSRPGSDPISAEEEIKRVVTVIAAIRTKSDIPISIDTTKSQVAIKAFQVGANMINDISAGTIDPKMFGVAADYKAPICLMHMRGLPKTMQTGKIIYGDLMAEICGYLKDRGELAIKAGVDREKILLDPGIGFGKTVEHNIEILKSLAKLKELNYPIVIGTSRKSFIGKILEVENPKERLEGSLATLAVAYRNGANIFRVHDVVSTRNFLRVLEAIH